LENADIFYGHLKYFMNVWDILWPFGTLVFIWYIYFGFWYHAPRKIWQPWFRIWHKAIATIYHWLDFSDASIIAKCDCKTKNGFDSIQSDQIGRIFAHWVIVCFGYFFENRRSSPHFGLLIYTVKVMYWICQKCIGLHFGLLIYTVKVIYWFCQKCIGLYYGRHFSQTHLVTLN
jgi:hypothetical protein